MKYIKPTIEIFALETKDIVTASSGNGSITADNITITGKKDEFFVDFSELTGK